MGADARHGLHSSHCAHVNSQTQAVELHVGPCRCLESEADSQEWHAPSQAYCCAILRNLRGSFPGITTLCLRATSGLACSEME